MNENEALMELANKIDLIWIMVLLMFIIFLVVRLVSFASEYNKIKIQYYSKKAERLFTQNRFNELIEYCIKKEEVQVFNGFALRWKGRALYELSDYNQAEKVFKIVISEHPHWAETITPYLVNINKKRNNI